MSHVETRWAFKQFPIPSWLWRGRVFSYLLLLIFFVPHAAAHASLIVEWKGERLSVVAERTPLSHVLQEVAKQTGIEFRGLEVLQENVSLNFERLPLLEGLRRLLAPANYVIIEKRSSQGAVLPAQAVIMGRVTPLTSETAPSEEAEQIENEQAVEMTRPDQRGLPLEDELTAMIIVPAQRELSLEDDQTVEGMSSEKGGVPLEDELTAMIIVPAQRELSLEDDQTVEGAGPEETVVPSEDELTTTEMIGLDYGSAPLEDELAAAMTNTDQGGVPLEEELAAAMTNPDQGGVPMEEELAAVTTNPDQGGVPMEEELAAVTTNPDQGGVPMEEELAAVTTNPDQGGAPLEDELVAGALN